MSEKILLSTLGVTSCAAALALVHLWQEPAVKLPPPSALFNLEEPSATLKLLSPPKTMAELDAENKERTVSAIAQVLEQDHQLDPGTAKNLAKSAVQEEAATQVQATLLLSVAKIESNFRNVRSTKSSAEGMMQIIPRWHKKTIEQHNITDLMQPDQSLKAASRILEEALTRFDGNLRMALLAYNGFSSKAYPRLVLSEKAKMDAKLVLAQKKTQERPYRLASLP